MATPADRRPSRRDARVVRNRKSVAERLAAIWRSRELVVALVRKELKVKYKDSALGFVWSMLNPMLYMAVFYVVFSLFLRNGIPLFPIWLLSGLLVWNLFATALPAATGSMVSNAALVKKVAFAREILPIASVGASLVHFVLQGTVLLVALAVFQRPIAWGYLWLLPLAVVYLLVLTSALGIALSAVNVGVRDAQHLLELVMLAWFWLTPIAYPFRQVSDKAVERGLPEWLFGLNPITPVVLVFQRALYAQTEVSGGIPLLPHWSPAEMAVPLVCGLVAATVLLAGCLRLFGRFEGSFAEEL